MVRGQGAIGGHLVAFEEPNELMLHAHEDAGLLHELHLFLQSQEDLDLLHELQTGESLKPSVEPPTRTSMPSFLKPTRVKAKPATPAPPRTKATIPTINICVQVKFITPSNIME
jgi:hypothetical protein